MNPTRTILTLTVAAVLAGVPAHADAPTTCETNLSAVYEQLAAEHARAERLEDRATRLQARVRYLRAVNHHLRTGKPVGVAVPR